MIQYIPSETWGKDGCVKHTGDTHWIKHKVWIEAQEKIKQMAYLKHFGRGLSDAQINKYSETTSKNNQRTVLPVDSL